MIAISTSFSLDTDTSDHGGSYEELSADLFYFSPSPVGDTGLQGTIDDYFRRLRALMQECSTVDLIPQLKELESDLAEELTVLEFQEEEEQEE